METALPDISVAPFFVADPEEDSWRNAQDRYRAARISFCLGKAGLREAAPCNPHFHVNGRRQYPATSAGRSASRPEWFQFADHLSGRHAGHARVRNNNIRRAFIKRDDPAFANLRDQDIVTAFSKTPFRRTNKMRHRQLPIP
jgi:hypothetical protein